MTDYTDVRHAYDTVAADYAERLPDTRAETALDLAMVDAFASAVLADATEASTAPVLDAGCGAGRMSAYLAARGVAVRGVDLSPGMVAMARRDHPELDFAVGSLDDLPCGDSEFAGVMLWYSIIHTPPPGLDRVLAEAVRVLRPGGHLLVGFQSGTGTRDVAPAYRRLGHEVHLERQLYSADEVASRLAAVGVHEVARLVRRATADERDDQAVVLARRT
ncbi:class I SAM-dependent methyltransferase [Humibacillus xanthopallidus]|uniref:class I SAM-dependent methyltransferase n=1 Tax=Humibacillus xanthopallidus TaxID=412689 RepID=UPI0038503D5B